MTQLSDGIGVRGDDSSRAMDETVHRAQAGEVNAFEKVYRAHVPAIRALCVRMCGDASEADELVQDVFVRAWEKLAGFRGQSTLATWLHRLAVNVVLEKWRLAKRHALRMIDDPDDDAFGAVARGGDPDVEMDLATAMEKLPVGARTEFVLYDIEGYSHDEIATMTGIASGTSRTQRFRQPRVLARLLRQ